MDNGFIVYGIFIDLQKAFDTDNHNILLKKLAHYGIRGNTNDWLRSYLTNRKQYVAISKKTITGRKRYMWCSPGVQPGCSPGPLLF